MSYVNNDLLTIKEFADLAGVTVQSVYKRLNNKLSTYIKLVDNQKMLEYKALYEVYGIEVESNLNQVEQPFKSDIIEKSLALLERQNEQLSKELDIKNNQIEELNKRLSECQKLLDQQQQLNVISERKYLELEDKIEEDKPKKKLLGFFKLKNNKYNSSYK